MAEQRYEGVVETLKGGRRQEAERRETETEIETDDGECFVDSLPVRHPEPEKSLFGTKI